LGGVPTTPIEAREAEVRGIEVRAIEGRDDVVRVLEPLYEAAVEAVRIDGDPDVSESVIAWNEGYYKGITDALARVQAGVVVSISSLA